MFIGKEPRRVRRFIPFRLIGHFIPDHLTVYDRIFEADVLYFLFFVVSGNDGQFGIFSRIDDVFEHNILNASAWEFAVLLIEKDAQVH